MISEGVKGQVQDMQLVQGALHSALHVQCRSQYVSEDMWWHLVVCALCAGSFAL